MNPKSRRQLQLATAAQKHLSAEDYALSNDGVYFMDISSDDE